MEFIKWFDEKVKDIESSLSSSIQEKKNMQNIIYEAMNYSLMSGGKRLRPVLLLGTFEMFSSDYKQAMPFALALEMIHTYSLIHDDLPAMDNDDYRRGRLSNHKKYGYANAILAGDALLNKAFEIALEGTQNGKLDLENCVKALNVIAKSSGADGMVGGQVIDMSGNDKIKSIEDLKYMYSLKTGAIIKSSVIAGAILGNANAQELDALKTYSENIGLAFQIEDDILDETSNLEKLGKKTGSDKANDKITYLRFKNIEESQMDVFTLTKMAIQSLSIFGDKADYLIKLAQFLTNRDH